MSSITAVPRAHANATVRCNPTRDLLELAARLDCLRLAQQLTRVSASDGEHDRLAPVTWLLASCDSAATLNAWAAQDSRLEPWARLANGLWHADDLMSTFPVVSDSYVVAEDYKGSIPRRYLAAMCASCDPEGDPKFVAWTRVLKLWTLIRAVDAAEAGHVWEPSLRNLTREIRLACEQGDQYRLEYFRQMVSERSPTTVDEFEASLRSTEAGDPADGRDRWRSQMRRLLTTVVACDWTADKASIVETFPVELAPPPLAPSVPADTSAPPRDNDLESPDDDAEDDGSGEVPVDPNATSSRQRRKTAGVALLNQAAGHVLPWDWHGLILDERFELIDAIESLTHVDNPSKQRVGGALMAIAILSSSTGRQVVDIEVRRASNTDWALDRKSGRLHRHAPRRERRWRQSGQSTDVANWVRGLTNDWTLALDARIADAIHAALPRSAKILGDAWRAVSEGQQFEQWVNEFLGSAPGLHRLTSPCLARVARQCAIEADPDNTLARLLSSNSRTVLPSPTSYASYPGAKVKITFGPPFARLATWVTPSDFAENNAAGSEMDVDSARFAQALSGLRERISVASESGDWVEHHNLMTSYAVISLLACTGSRPVLSPFESLTWFNLTSRLLYIDDKAVGTRQSGRLAILAESVAAVLEEAYLPHLAALGKALATVAPEFSSAIEECLTPQGSPKLPLFFFIKASPSLEWTEVSEIGLSEKCGNDWPLPWNFARHRLATGLRRLRLDPEIIDALLGHGEAGSETHGPYSLRVQESDLSTAGPLIERLTQELAIRPPMGMNAFELTGLTVTDRSQFNEDARFGSEARSERRDAAHARAGDTANADIMAAIGKRNAEALRPEEWEAIGRAMLLRSDNLPHPFASIRYATFEDFLDRIWHKKGVRPKIRRRHALPQPPNPGISPVALHAQTTRAAAISVFQDVVEKLDEKQLRPQLAKALAAIDMCLFGRIADASLLNLIVKRGHGATVRYQGNFYLESYGGQTWEDGTPVRRFAISERAERWHRAGRQERKDSIKPGPIPPVLAPVAHVLQCSATSQLPDLLRRLGDAIDQCNLLELSGFEAAVLAGRISISALPFSDWVRSQEDKALLLPLESEGTSDNDEVDDDGLDEIDAQRIRTPEACRKLMQTLRQALVEGKSRDDQRAAARRVLRSSPFTRGDLPYAFGRWICNLLTRPSKTHGDVLKPSTILTYLNTLAGRVAAAGYDAHLPDLDSEELTDLYRALLEVEFPRDVTQERDRPQTPEKKAQAASNSPPESLAIAVENQITDSKDRTYVAHRLIEFHTYAQHLYGLEDPDWSELGDPTGQPIGRPGVITPKEYASLLSSLVGIRATRTTDTAVLERAWALLLGYRFGLRAAEAVGLRHEDWIERSGAIVALVRSSYIRGLKTPQSRRAVPLIGTLSAVERSVADELLRRWDERSGDERGSALISGITKATFRFRKMQVTGPLLRHIKKVTRNPKATFHHTRHAFANCVFALIAGNPTGLGSAGAATEKEVDSARKLLLASSRPDRRTLWALCRLLGHSSPATLVRCYLHCQVNPPKNIEPAVEGHHPCSLMSHDLDAIGRDESYLSPAPIASQPPHESEQGSTLAALLNFLRLRRIGRPLDVAAYVVGINLQKAVDLEALLAEVAPRLERSHAKQERMSRAEDLLSRVASGEFDALIDRARERIDICAAAQMKDAAWTVGASRQVLLFRPSHFNNASGFLSAMQLARKDVIVLTPKRLSPPVRELVRSSPLAALVPDASEAPRLQLDVASVHVEGELAPSIFDDRVGVAVSSGLFKSAYALVIAWCSFCLTETSSRAAS